MILKMVVTDLDGTLLRDDKTVCETDRATFQWLGEKNVVRVAATGRSLYSVAKVIPDDFPFDYIVFSTGSGVFDIKQQKIIVSYGLKNQDIQKITQVLFKADIDFTIHKPIPENHCFLYFARINEHPGFKAYRDFYQQYATPIDLNKPLPEEACQFLSIMDKDLEKFEQLKNQLSNYKVIRTTSPIDHQTLWLEIFPAQVSKGDAVAWLCQRLGIHRNEVLAIGNDFNDIDVLDFAGNSRIVANAHEELRHRYPLVANNNQNGVTHAIMEFLTRDV